MRFSSAIVRSLMLVLAFALLPLAMPATTSAEPTTIYAELGRCRANVDAYQVQLQSRVFTAPAADFPASVTVHFANGTTAEAYPFLGPNGGTVTYRLSNTEVANTDIPVTTATAQFDTAKYPNYRFTVVARPCLPDTAPTFAVTGTITQHGNQKPVAGLEVCLVEAGLCTITDANGYFEFTGVANGTYTLTSDGPVYKPLATTVEVNWADAYIDLVQFRGGGR